MAAMLTSITRIPYDAQHLPITPATMKWVKKDTAIRFEVEVPKDATSSEEAGRAEGEEGQKSKEKKTEEKKTEETKKEELRRDEEGGQKKTTRRKTRRRRARRRAGAEEPKTTKTLYFEYDLATGKLALLPDFKPDPKKPGWAQVSPDDKTVVFARGHNLFMMDEANYKAALKDFGDPKVQEVQLTTDGEEHYSFARG
jgi:hypothetical protein